MTSTGIATHFANAWEDLDERITGGIASLNGLAKQRPSDADRLTRKGDGLRKAHDLYVTLDSQGEDSFDVAGAWRTFEASLAALVREESDDEVRRGLLLANGYQRGYGADVDAAPLYGG
jgi:hypothetical protein